MSQEAGLPREGAVNAGVSALRSTGADKGRAGPAMYAFGQACKEIIQSLRCLGFDFAATYGKKGIFG